jgi:hypothetical protein
MVAEWLGRKHEEVGARFYRSQQRLPDVYDADLLSRILYLAAYTKNPAVSQSILHGLQITLIRRRPSTGSA